MHLLFDTVFGQPALSLIGYGLCGWSIVRAIWHTISQNPVKRALRQESSQLAHMLERMETQQSLGTLGHPVARVAQRIESAGGWLVTAAEQRQRWLDYELAAVISPLWTARVAAQEQAVFFGLLGTLGGFLVGADAFADHGNVALTLKAIALSLITSLIGGIVAQWEAANTRWVVQLEQELQFCSAELLTGLAAYFETVAANQAEQAAEAQLAEASDSPERESVPLGSFKAERTSHDSVAVAEHNKEMSGIAVGHS